MEGLIASSKRSSVESAASIEMIAGHSPIRISGFCLIVFRGLVNQTKILAMGVISDSARQRRTESQPSVLRFIREERVNYDDCIETCSRSHQYERAW